MVVEELFLLPTQVLQLKWRHCIHKMYVLLLIDMEEYQRTAQNRKLMQNFILVWVDGCAALQEIANFQMVNKGWTMNWHHITTQSEWTDSQAVVSQSHMKSDMRSRISSVMSKGWQSVYIILFIFILKYLIVTLTVWPFSQWFIYEDQYFPRVFLS